MSCCSCDFCCLVWLSRCCSVVEFGDCWIVWCSLYCVVVSLIVVLVRCGLLGFYIDMLARLVEVVGVVVGVMCIRLIVSMVIVARLVVNS